MVQTLFQQIHPVMAVEQFTLDNVKDIEQIQGVDKVAPVISTNTTVKVDKNSQSTSVTGTTSNFLDIRNMTISEGRFIADFRCRL